MLQDKREKQDKLAESNLYIKNLDDTQTDDKLRQLFEVTFLLLLLRHFLISSKSSLLKACTHVYTLASSLVPMQP